MFFHVCVDEWAYADGIPCPLQTPDTHLTWIIECKKNWHTMWTFRNQQIHAIEWCTDSPSLETRKHLQNLSCLNYKSIFQFWVNMLVPKILLYINIAFVLLPELCMVVHKPYHDIYHCGSFACSFKSSRLIFVIYWQNPCFLDACFYFKRRFISYFAKWTLK